MNNRFFENNSADIETKSYFPHLVSVYSINVYHQAAFSLNCTIFGTLYRNGLFLSITLNGITELIEIEEIIKVKSNYHIVGKLWQCGEFDEHYLAFKVNSCTKLYKIIPLAEFDGLPTTVSSIANQL